MGIPENLHEITSNLRKVALECGRRPDEIKLVAVSKRFPSSAIKEAIEAGHTLFGENYIQEAEEKITEIGEKGKFHFIGHLQSNKAKIAAGIFDVIETIDSFKLARMLNNRLVQLERTMDVLVQVNIGNEASKSGVQPSETGELIKEISNLSNINVIGLMTMPPFTEDPELARPHFKELRLLAEDLKNKGLFPPDRPVELSMGMSNDYHVAIQEGATIIRIGTAIFGQRQS